MNDKCAMQIEVHFPLCPLPVIVSFFYRVELKVPIQYYHQQKGPQVIMPQAGMSALMLAAIDGHTEVAALLIERGAEVQAKDDVRSISLCCCVLSFSFFYFILISFVV